MGRLNAIAWMFVVAIAALGFLHFFNTSWSNRCDPGNAQFSLLKDDSVVGFHPDGRLFSWENNGPDNSWLCSNPSLSVSHIGPDVNAMYEATRADMTASGWVGGETFLKNQDFVVYEKVKNGVRLNAVVSKNPFWVEVDMNAPGLHPGESGFGG